jgi:hypothetical protein
MEIGDRSLFTAMVPGPIDGVLSGIAFTLITCDGFAVSGKYASFTTDGG